MKTSLKTHVMVSFGLCRASEGPAGGVCASAEDRPCSEAAGEEGPHHSQAPGCQHRSRRNPHLSRRTLWEHTDTNSHTPLTISKHLMCGSLSIHSTAKVAGRDATVCKGANVSSDAQNFFCIFAPYCNCKTLVNMLTMIISANAILMFCHVLQDTC